MLDFTRKAKLAVSDKVRQIVMKIAAAVVLLIGAGFLLSALWLLLAEELGWGGMWASTAIGGGAALIGLVLLVIGGKAKHEPPSASELGDELSARASLAADAALGKLRHTADDVLGSAETRVHGFVDRLTGKSRQAAQEAKDFGEHAAGFAQTVASDLSSGAKTVAQEGAERARAGYEDARDSRMGPGLGVLGAFAVGLAIASRLRGKEDDDEFYDEFDHRF